MAFIGHRRVAFCITHAKAKSLTEARYTSASVEALQWESMTRLLTTRASESLKLEVRPVSLIPQ